MSTKPLYNIYICIYVCLYIHVCLLATEVVNFFSEIIALCGLILGFGDGEEGEGGREG